jgi:hypothetical protein
VINQVVGWAAILLGVFMMGHVLGHDAGYKEGLRDGKKSRDYPWNKIK